MRNFTIVLGLLFALTAQAQSAPDITGDRKVPTYGFAELSVNAPVAVIWRVYPKPVMQRIRSNVLYFGGLPGTEYTVEAITIDFAKQTFDQSETTVTFGDDPVPPGPGPGPGPGPTPTDPLVKALQDAANTESADKPLIPKLAEMYTEAQAKVDASATWGDLYAAMATIAANKGVAGKLMNVQKVLQIQLNGVFPTKGGKDVPIDPAGKQTAKTAFSQIAAALKKVK